MITNLTYQIESKIILNNFITTKFFILSLIFNLLVLMTTEGFTLNIQNESFEQTISTTSKK